MEVPPRPSRLRASLPPQQRPPRKKRTTFTGVLGFVVTFIGSAIVLGSMFISFLESLPPLSDLPALIGGGLIIGLGLFILFAFPAED